MAMDRRAVVMVMMAVAMVGCKSAQPTVAAANGGGDGGAAADGSVVKASYATVGRRKRKSPIRL